MPALLQRCLNIHLPLMLWANALGSYSSQVGRIRIFFLLGLLPRMLVHLKMYCMPLERC